MAYEQRDNQGALFRNDNREKDTHPNARGKAMIGGVMYMVSAWTKEGKNGKFQSLSFKPEEAQPQPAQPQRTQSVAKPRSDFNDMKDDLDDVPF